MKKHLSKSASGGIPLRQTDSASVEKYLIEKVRSDLGDYKDLALITPVLRVDTEDGDLSGNITNGFGNIMLDVRGTKLHLPFMIHQKELIPFDVIRMGDQEVPYDVSKLRKIVNGVDKHARESEDQNDEGKNFEIGHVVDRKYVPSGNGFLGTIMQVRDDEVGRGGNGVIPWTGMDFGSMDDERMDGRYASAKVDVLEVFHEAVEKLASVKAIPRDEVLAFVKQVEKKAADESQQAIDAIKAVSPDTLEAAGIRRGMAKLNDEKLVDVSRVASGNNIKFPIADQGLFEYRYGRVYHKLEPWAKNDTSAILSPVKSIVVDSRLGYKLLLSADNKFMTTLDNPPVFEFKMERARGLEKGHVYAMEIDTSTISHPFEVDYGYEQGMLGSGIHYKDNDRTSNSLFMDAISCQEVMPSKEKAKTGQDASFVYDWTYNRRFVILIPRDESLKEIQHITPEELDQLIQSQAKDPMDARLARNMTNGGNKDIYIVPQEHLFYKLEKAIEGFFTRPDGYFQEGPLVKHAAAYDDLNKATLKVERDRQPRLYGIEFQFNVDVPDGEGTPAVQTQKRELTGLSEAQARQKLQDLGFDHRQAEILFEMCRRNGRSGTLALPDPEKASGVSPGDVGAAKSVSAFKNIINHTFNADNFVPVLGDVMSAGLAGAIGNAAPGASDFTRSLGDWFKTSFDVAVGLEKVAVETQGESWHEVAALVNLKHRIDKFACDIATGHYVVGLKDVFEKVAALKPNISAHAKNLIEFNRSQILLYDKAPVSTQLIKQALHELDGLYRYASVHPASMEKTAAENPEGPHRSMMPFLGERVVGRPTIGIIEALPGGGVVTAVRDKVNDTVDGLMDRLAASVEVSGLGK